MANAILWQELDAIKSDTSSASLPEPRACFNEDCLFPMGPACDECALVSHLLESGSERLSNSWTLKPAVRSQATNSAAVEGIRQVGCDDEDTTTVLSTEDPDENFSEISVTALLNNKYPYSNIEEWTASVPQYLEEPEEDPYRSLERPNSAASTILEVLDQNSDDISRGSQSSNTSTPSIYLERGDRLVNRFNSTLRAQRNSIDFYGGGNNEYSTLEPCPLCHGPVGDPIYQHVLRCQYAYDEIQRKRRMIESIVQRNMRH